WHKETVYQNVVTAIDPKTGEKTINQDSVPHIGKTTVNCPAVLRRTDLFDRNVVGFEHVRPFFNFAVKFRGRSVLVRGSALRFYAVSSNFRRA
ncbi:MAG: hypothetical protein ABIS45_14715, partial [Burkholderiales bacterium]